MYLDGTVKNIFLPTTVVAPFIYQVGESFTTTPHCNPDRREFELASDTRSSLRYEEVSGPYLKEIGEEI